MNIEQAIEHLVEIIPSIKCEDCREEHKQLLEWLIQNKTMQEMLRGKCWACKYGTSYKRQFGGIFEDIVGLTICTIGEQGEDVIAKTQKQDCEKWELKQYGKV